MKSSGNQKNVLFLHVQKNAADMNLNILLFNLGPMEIILIVAVVVLLFGGKKIPELMKGIGQGMKEFKKATHIDKDEPEPEDKEKKKY
jgi:sec-independent protein translocase protein TatA